MRAGLVRDLIGVDEVAAFLLRHGTAVGVARIARLHAPDGAGRCRVCRVVTVEGCTLLRAARMALERM